MTTRDHAAHFDLLIERGFLDALTCEKIVAEMRAARGGPATVYGLGESGSVDERMRKTTHVVPSPETAGFIRRRLLEHMRLVGEHFGVRLVECEEPQFLRYEVGGYFVAHQDGNTGLLRSERESRRVSLVIFLNPQSEANDDEHGTYRGGSLVFHGSAQSGARLSPAAEAGMLVAFRAETTHEVEMVTHGARYSIVCWYR
jgi:SM-20-related protein